MNEIDLGKFVAEPKEYTVTMARDELYVECPDGRALSWESPAREIELASRRVVRCSTAFSVLQLGLLEAELLRDPYRVFGRRLLRPLVRGIMAAIKEVQVRARAAARKAASTKKEN